MPWTARQIADLVEGELQGEASVRVDSMEALDRARPHQLTFIGEAKYADAWRRSGAAAALAVRDAGIEPGEGRALILVDDADLATAKVLEEMAPPPPRPDEGVHERAAVHPSARLGANVRIGPHCTVGPNTVIGDNTVLHPSVTILDGCRIGSDCVIWPGVVIRERCRIGERCILHPNASIGGDGFGYRPGPGGRGVVKIPQIGTVEIGDDVEIGCGACVDRGKFAATTIGDQAKLDNHVQIAHNCRIGSAVILASHTAIGGSTTVGDGAMFGGGVIVRDHIHIGAGAKIMAFAGLVDEVPDGATWGGYMAHDGRAAVRELIALRKLPDLLRRMKKSEAGDQRPEGGGPRPDR